LFYDPDELSDRIQGVYATVGTYGKTGGGGLFFTADDFVDGELIPCHRGDCGSAPPRVSAVRMDSWARIKASFR